MSYAWQIFVRAIKRRTILPDKGIEDIMAAQERKRELQLGEGVEEEEGFLPTSTTQPQNQNQNSTQDNQRQEEE